MMGRDLCRPDPERHGALHLTEAAHPVLRGEESVTLRHDTTASKPATVLRTQVSEEDEPLLSALKAKRRALAEAARVPAYVIFPDRTLIEMASRRPATLDALAGITGVGSVKLERFGPVFLEVLTGAVPPPLHPARRKLAGEPSGDTFDRLQSAQRELARGSDGLAKPLNCTATTLARIAELRPATLDELERIQGMGPQKTDRFGPAFLAILHPPA
jgi:ATP-dependent DNA helicase RecQ